MYLSTRTGFSTWLLYTALRQLIFVLPAAWLFARLLPAGVWLAFPIAEVLTAVIAAVLLRHTAGKGRLSQQDHAASPVSYTHLAEKMSEFQFHNLNRLKSAIGF